MELNAAVQKVLRYLGNGAVCCKGKSKQPKPGELQKEKDPENEAAYELHYQNFSEHKR